MKAQCFRLVRYAIVSSPVILAAALIATGCSTSQKPGDSTASHDSYTVSSGGSKKSTTGYQLPAFEEKTLENGLHILFVPDDKLPYTTYSMLIRSGSTSDPQDQAGLASLVADLLNKGTAKRSATQMAQDLGNMGADFSGEASADYTELSASSLSSVADQLLTDFSEIVMQPAFSDSEIERVKKQYVAEIERRVDSPEGFADLAFAQMLYPDHPYGRPINGTLASMDVIKKKNIIQFYLRNYRPSNALMAVVGKYTPAMKEKIEKTFAAWPNREVPEIKFPPIAAFQNQQILVMNKADMVQAQIRFGYPGIDRKNPDYVALRVANTILGGAFASRLTHRIRKELGLTYSISSFFDARKDRGPFEIETFTKSETIGQTVSETLKVLAEYHDKGATSEELERTKGYLKGLFPAAIETPEKLAFNLMLLRFHGIPDSYLNNYLQEVDHLSLSEINRVITKYFDAKDIKVLVYGNGAQAEAQLRPLVQAPNTLEVKDAVAEKPASKDDKED
jgi:zinc protease